MQPINYDVQMNYEKIDSRTSLFSVLFSIDSEAMSFIRFILRPAETVSEEYRNLIFGASGSCIIADVYPLNGVVKKGRFAIKDYVRPAHRLEIADQAAVIDELVHGRKHVRCLVIDFKDTSKSYKNVGEISTVETVFNDFFRSEISGRSTQVQREIHRVISDARIDFFINEGSLKANLQEQFTEGQRRYFDKPENSRLLCQICEVIMNGFKRGCEVVVNEKTFNPQDYIRFLNAPAKDGGMNRRVSDNEGGCIPEAVSLLTLYPDCYKETYSSDSQYYQLINKIDRVAHEYKNNMTIIRIN